MKEFAFIFSSEILLYSQKPTIAVDHICVPNVSNPHPTINFTFVFFFYICLVCQAAFCVRLFPSKHCPLLVCTVPCPIKNKETDFQYDLRKLAFSFRYLPSRNGRELFLQSGDKMKVVM